MKEKIKHYLGFFEVKERDNGSSYIAFTDNAPEELKDIIRKAPGNKLASDWVFDTYHSIRGAMLHSDVITEDTRHEIVDGLVEV